MSRGGRRAGSGRKPGPQTPRAKPTGPTALQIRRVRHGKFEGYARLWLDCGHAPSPHTENTDGSASLPDGSASLPDGKTVCYKCAAEWQRGVMATSEHFGAYLSGDGTQITTFDGSSLATVTHSVVRIRKGTCEFCKAPDVALPATLTADPDQAVCETCHKEPRIPTTPR